MGIENVMIDVSRKRFEARRKLSQIFSDTASAALMILAAVVAIILSNTALYEPLHHAMMTPIGVSVGERFVGLPLEVIVNDLLMAVFFLLMGCDLKYQMTVGALAQPKQAILPMVAALGGVAGPAAIYLLLNPASSMNGWAIPTATDIAFALAVMSLLGDRVPLGAKVFFSTLAIADDLFAIIIIALFYSTSVSLLWLAGAAGATLALFLLNRAKTYQVLPYLLIGCVLWLCFYFSGVHATLAGVVLAFALPARTDVQLQNFTNWLVSRANVIDDAYDASSRVLGQHKVTELAQQLKIVSGRVTPPLQRVEHAISWPTNFLILPLFAFVNAQISFAGADMLQIATDPVTYGVVLGAVVGKPLGILLLTAIMVFIFRFKLPDNVRWGHMLGVGILGGIGFTMSILISGLAFANETNLLEAKLGIIIASVLSAGLGLAYFHVYLKHVETKEAAKAAEALASVMNGGTRHHVTKVCSKSASAASAGVAAAGMGASSAVAASAAAGSVVASGAAGAADATGNIGVGVPSLVPGAYSAGEAAAVESARAAEGATVALQGAAAHEKGGAEGVADTSDSVADVSGVGVAMADFGDASDGAAAQGAEPSVETAAAHAPVVSDTPTSAVLRAAANRAADDDCDALSEGGDEEDDLNDNSVLDEEGRD